MAARETETDEECSYCPEDAVVLLASGVIGAVTGEDEVTGQVLVHFPMYGSGSYWLSWAEIRHAEWRKGAWR